MQGYCMPLEEEEHHGNAVLSAVGTTTGGRGKNTITPPSKSIMQASAQVDAWACTIWLLHQFLQKQTRARHSEVPPLLWFRRNGRPHELMQST